MSENIISVKEFRELGFLQELNRQFLHPLGLALEVHVDSEGNETLGRIWDSRKEESGISFFEPLSLSKIQYVEELRLSKIKARKDLNKNENCFYTRDGKRLLINDNGIQEINLNKPELLPFEGKL